MPAAYLAPAAAFDALLEKLDDVELTAIVKEREGRGRSRSRWMTYRVLFKDTSLKEWRKLDDSIRERFKKKLRKHLAEPRVEAARLSGMPNCCKRKLKSAGYRLAPGT